jgi:hypothetical protein
MKNQYFADPRDFMKYDLLVEITEGVPGISRLTNIPMLTPNDDTGEGNFLLAYERGIRRPDLYHFLQYCLARGDRNIRNLRTLFQGRYYSYYGHRDDLPYVHDRRQEYFTSIPSRYLQDAVVFIDPDTGIETGGMAYMRDQGIDRYLFWDNIIQTFDRVSGTSILIVYQHLQRNAHLVVQNMQDKSVALCTHINVPAVAVVDDGDVAFLITAANPDIFGHIAQSLPEYAALHGLRYHLFANSHMTGKVNRS